MGGARPVLTARSGFGAAGGSLLPRDDPQTPSQRPLLEGSPGPQLPRSRVPGKHTQDPGIAGTGYTRIRAQDGEGLMEQWNGLPGAASQKRLKNLTGPSKPVSHSTSPPTISLAPVLIGCSVLRAGCCSEPSAKGPTTGPKLPGQKARLIRIHTRNSNNGTLNRRT
jgi:hypothetical protein